MNYTEDYYKLRSVFNPDVKEIAIPGSSVRIIHDLFVSEIDPKEFLIEGDSSIIENITFSYPVFIPHDKTSKKVILLLHGLNERSWAKYLVWVYWLSLITGSYVVLFPISFHINRSPSSWMNPRIMKNFVEERHKSFSEIRMSSFANIALSTRLTEEPMRFFNSGYQTAFDIIKLIKQIRSGNHSIIPEGSRVNIMAYSIGAFLAQILLMGNPDNLFSETKLFMFCGGSVFCSMYGTSKFIMDNMAYKKIYSFYQNDFETEITRKNPFSVFLKSTQIGMAFRSMIDLCRFRSFRESMLGRLKEQIRSIALKGDKVMPVEGILSTMAIPSKRRCETVDVWDLPYPYSHENPFPLISNQLHAEVDMWFERMITRAGLFLG